LGLDSVVNVTEVSSDYFSQEYFSQRPASERLRNKKLEIIGLNTMRDWRIALKEYLDEYYS